MNRSYSRFVPNGSRSVSASRKGTVVRAKKRRSGRAYWFPIVTMIAAVMFAASAVMPRSVFDAFADTGSYSLAVQSGAGGYTVTLTGDSDGVSVTPDTVGAFAKDDDDTVVLTVSESGNYTITSAAPMSSVIFGSGASAVTS